MRKNSEPSELIRKLASTNFAGLYTALREAAEKLKATARGTYCSVAIL
jgi:hypothetical protein